MITIANPIYDTVFRYLMEDNKSAKILIGALLEVEIVELEMRQTEYSFKVKNDLDIMRIDFGAKIKDKEGQLRIVTIELQKAKLEGDVMRFRKYLAAQYKNKDNCQEVDGHKVPYPIVSIFIMGYPCSNIVEPVIYEVPEFYDVEHHRIENLESEFIFGLIHRMIIVQIPYLRKNIKTRVERILSVFDQSYRIDKKAKNAHVLKVPEDMDDQQYSWLVRQLVKANVDEKLQDEMDQEDDVYDEIDYWQKLLENMDNKLKEQNDKLKKQNDKLKENESKLKEKDDKLKEKDDKLKAQDDKLAEQQNQLAEQQNQLVEKDRKTAQKLSAMGQSVDEIADFLSVDADTVRKYLN